MAKGNKGGAPKGNNNREKFKTPAERLIAYLAYCEHIAQGYTQMSFHAPCTFETIDRMLEKYPEEFDAELLTTARAKGLFVWDKMGLDGAKGLLPNFNSGTWIFNAKNRLGFKDVHEIGFDKDKPAVFMLKMGKATLTAEKGE